MTNPTSLTVEQLLPCPFCGKQPERIGTRVLCDGLVGSSVVHSSFWMSPDEWNTRHLTSTDRLRDALEKCRDQFRFYEREHEGKARAFDAKVSMAPDTPGGQAFAETDRRMAAAAREKAATNKRFADLADEALTSTPAPTGVGPSEADMAAFGASDAACYYYPGEDQAKERAAFCEGAAHAVVKASTPAPSGEREAEVRLFDTEDDAWSDAQRYAMDDHTLEREELITFLRDRGFIRAALQGHAPSGEREALERLTKALAKVSPITTHDTPDYAELSFGEHQTQAMTVMPADWQEIEAAFQAARAALQGHVASRTPQDDAGERK